MINPEDYPKINPENNTGKYVSEREMSFVQSCFNKEQKDKEDNCIKNLQPSNPDSINEKRKTIIQIFNYFDKDNSGIINVSDMRNILQILGVKEEGFSHVDLLINRAEIEGNGYISYRDFVYNIIK